MSFMAAKKMLMVGARPLRPQDVFATSLYTGSVETPQTITNGLDLAGKGGLTWIKSRSTAVDHYLFDTERGAQKWLRSNSDVVEGSRADTLTSFEPNGFALGIDGNGWVNFNGRDYAAWSFRQADKFFAIRLIQHTTGTASTISLPSFGPIGMVIGKNRSASGNWPVWHRSLPAGQGKQLNLQTAAGTTEAWISVSGQTVTLSGSAPSGNYVLYVFAQNPDLIDCGTFNIPTNGGTATVQCGVGWTPQFILAVGTFGGGNWIIADTTRGWRSGNDLLLAPNSSGAETSVNTGNPTQTGFEYTSSSGQRIYLAIRSPT